MAPGWVWFGGQGGVSFSRIAPCVSQMWVADSIRVPLDSFYLAPVWVREGWVTGVGASERSSPFKTMLYGQFTTTTEHAAFVVLHTVYGQVNQSQILCCQIWWMRWGQLIYNRYLEYLSANNVQIWGTRIRVAYLYFMSLYHCSSEECFLFLFFFKLFTQLQLYKSRFN